MRPRERGETYGACCSNKGATYVAVVYGSRKFFYDATAFEENVNRMLHFAYYNIIEQYRAGISIQLEEALSHLRTLYESLDNILEPFLKHSSCKAGCPHCCHLIVETTAIEARMTHRYIEEVFPEEEKLRLVLQISKNAAHYPKPVNLGGERPDDAPAKGRFDDPCPFLSDERTCRVYHARPLACRMHFAFSPPDQCRSPMGGDLYEASFYPQVTAAVECLSAITYVDLKFERHLADWFINEFRPTP